MWIKKIKLENLRSFEYAEIEFSKGINILLGANNSGKSTILLSMLTLQRIDSYISKDDIRKGANSVKIIYNFADIPKKYFNHFYINYVDVGISKGMEHSSAVNESYAKYNNPDKVEILNHFEMQFLHSNNADRFSITKKYRLSGSAGELSNFSDIEPDNFIYPFLCKRKVNQYSTDVSRKISNKIMKNLDNLPARVDSVLNPSLDQFNEFRAFCSDVLEIPITTFSVENGKDIGLSVQSSIHIPMTYMGEGSNIVGLLANLCLAKEGSLFIIEEIENDLHPKALKKLLEIIKLKSQKNQFIISTHSHIVAKYLGAADNANLFEVRMVLKDKMPTSTVSLLKNPDERLNALEKLGYEYNDYGLTKGWLVLEESSAQRIIESFLIPWFVPKLTNQIRIIATNGFQNIEDKFTSLQNHFLFIHLEKEIYLNKAWVIIDGGEKEKKVIQDLKNKFCIGENKYWKEDHFLNFEEHDFEKYYPPYFNEKIIQIEKIDKQDKKKKREEKEKLLKDVINWAEKNKEEAIKQFNESAKEVIDKLKIISNELD